MEMTRTLRILLSAANIFVVGVGGTLIFLGIWLFNDYLNYGHLTPNVKLVVLPGTVLFVCGLFVIGLAVVGCIATCRCNKCITGVYMTLLLIVFIGLVLGMALGYLYRNKMADDLESEITDDLKQYDINADVTSEIDFMQQKLECCGVNNYTDWLDTPWRHNHSHTLHNQSFSDFPDSCCPRLNCTLVANHTSEIPYRRGCYSELKYAFKRYMIVVASVAAAFLIVQVLAMVCICIAACRPEKDIPYTLLGNPNGGMRV